MRVVAVVKNDYMYNKKSQNSNNAISISFCSNNGVSDFSYMANRLFELGQKELPSFLSTMRDIAQDLPLFARVKKPYSIISRMERKGVSSNQSFAEYKKAVNDLLGVTILSDNDKSTEKIVDNLVSAVKARKIKVLRVKNHTQSNLPYYLSHENINKIHAANQEAGLERMSVLHDNGLNSEDGFIGTNILGQTANGCLFELQIKGPKVRNIDIGFHIPWSILTNKKNIIPSDETARLNLKPLESACLNLTPSQIDAYNTYQRAAYKAAREDELGLQSEYPQLPNSLPVILDFNNVLRIHHLVVGK